MNTLSSKYFGESPYEKAVAIENFRERARWFETPSYMKPPSGKMPIAEKGRCCVNQGSMFHFISHHLP